MKNKYQPNRATPYLRSNFQPFKWVAPSKKTIVDNKDSVEYVNPELEGNL